MNCLLHVFPITTCPFRRCSYLPILQSIPFLKVWKTHDRRLVIATLWIYTSRVPRADRFSVILLIPPILLGRPPLTARLIILHDRCPVSMVLQSRFVPTNSDNFLCILFDRFNIGSNDLRLVVDRDTSISLFELLA